MTASLLHRMTRFAAVATVILGIAAGFYRPAPTTAAPPQRVVDKKLPATMLRLRVTDVVVGQDLNGNAQLFALVALGDHPPQPFPIDLAGISAADPADAGGLVVAQQTCNILDLALGPIELDVLGLNVVTSEICLRVTGEQGPGNLLGNLLCGLAGLLDGGGLLGDFLDLLSDAELDALLQGIEDLLNGALGAVTAPTSVVGVSDAPGTAATCDILNLALGPIDLNLLGLDVELDDCDGGPVTVDIFAVPGPGNLLGNLLCNLAGLLDRPAAGPAIANALNRVANAIEQLVRVLG